MHIGEGQGGGANHGEPRRGNLHVAPFPAGSANTLTRPHRMFSERDPADLGLLRRRKRDARALPLGKEAAG